MAPSTTLTPEELYYIVTQLLGMVGAVIMRCGLKDHDVVLIVNALQAASNKVAELHTSKAIPTQPDKDYWKNQLLPIVEEQLKFHTPTLTHTIN
jgi:hypothetical protein